MKKITALAAVLVLWLFGSESFCFLGKSDVRRKEQSES